MSTVRVWLYVNRFGPWSDRCGSRCWLWTGAVAKSGYGAFKDWGCNKNWRAHRLVWTLLRGPIPAKLQLDHKCLVKHCVRPGHTEPVTALVNTRRAIEVRGRWGPIAGRKERCPQDHEFTEENTYINPSGHRLCRLCMLDAKHRYRAKLRARGEKVR